MKYVKLFKNFSYKRSRLIREFVEKMITTNQLVEDLDKYSKGIKINKYEDDREIVDEKQKEFRNKIIEETNKLIIDLLDLKNRSQDSSIIKRHLEKITLIDKIYNYIHADLRDVGILVHHFFYSKHEFNVRKDELKKYLDSMIDLFSKNIPFIKDFNLNKDEISFFDRENYHKQLETIKKKLKNKSMFGTWKDLYTKISDETGFPEEEIIKIKTKEMLSGGNDLKKIIKETGLTQNQIQEISNELDTEKEEKDPLSNKIYDWDWTKEIIEQLLFNYQDTIISTKDEIVSNTLNKMKVIQKGIVHMSQLQEKNDFNLFSKINVTNSETIRKSLSNYLEKLLKESDISKQILCMRNHNYDYDMNTLHIFINLLYNIINRMT